MDHIITVLAQELGKDRTHISNVISLLDEGSTIPFIARYRKELHGAMDDTTLRTLETRLQYLRGLDERRNTILSAIETQGKLTAELKQSIFAATTLAELEDLYRPFKQKRRTRATLAREKGLAPLAELILAQTGNDSLSSIAESFVNPELGVKTVDDALSGASDIIAEEISDDAELRKELRGNLLRDARLTVTAATEEDTVYKNYYNFSQSINRIQNHQILAINRGEKEKILKVSVDSDHNRAAQIICRKVIRPGSFSMAFLRTTVADAYERLLFPSLERELRSTLTARACDGAISQFSTNLRQLLLQPPVKGKVTMGLDPGYRMGCKVAVVDATGKVLDTTVVYPTHGDRQRSAAIQKLSTMTERWNVEHIAIGNGTASRETEAMAVELIRNENAKGAALSYMIVSEAGASVYSASELAAEEFPQFDVNLRSAVSIARRLQDPLAELVKIDPKAIGVGQYQHDMPQKQLTEALDAVVEDCVNAVGVDVNTASPSLLTHISGLSSALAKNIVAYREANGPFSSRSQLLKVSKLGPKAYQQCAGFLRIPGSSNLLDNTAVHPESYAAASALLAEAGYSMRTSGQITYNQDLSGLRTVAEKIGLSSLASQLKIGVLTLNDIIDELMKPGRDLRSTLPQPVLRTDVLEFKDLKAGMVLSGTVRNVIDFGAFVDIGIHQDGLVHISEISNRYIRHPSEVLSVGDVVKVAVLSVDEKRKRISLSIKQSGSQSN